MAAWVAMVAARSTMPEAINESVKRRVILANSRAFAREYILRNVLTEASGTSVPADPSTESAPEIHASGDTSDVWGSFTMSSFGSNPPSVDPAPLNSTNLTAGFNRLSPANNNYGYYVDLGVEVSDGVGMIASRFFAKSRSLSLASDLLVVGKSAQNPDFDPQVAAVSGEYFAANGRAFYANPPAAGHVYNNIAASFATADVGAAVGFAPTTSGGGYAYLSNFPSVPMTGGRSGSNLGYDGTLDVIDNAANPGSLKARVLAGEYLAVQAVNGGVAIDQRGVAGAGDGTVEIDLNEITLTNVFIEDGVTTLNIRGQATEDDFNNAAGYPAVMLVVAQAATDLTTVNFYEENNRRIVVAVKNPNYSTLTWNWMNAVETALPATRLDYRLLLTCENVDLDLTFPGDAADVNITGGIQLDRRLIVGSNNERVTVNAEPISPTTSNTAAFAERYHNRVAWLETFVP
jgi:hypothetical protein